jgi:hypothetical protein
VREVWQGRSGEEGGEFSRWDGGDDMGGVKGLR